MHFNPDSVKPLPAGTYEFEVLRAEEKTSSAGNDMMVLKLRAGTSGDSRTVTDYILAKNTFKIRMAAKACDILDLFLSGEILPEHFLGKKGRVVLSIEESRNLGEPGRNVVDRYVIGGR